MNRHAALSRTHHVPAPDMTKGPHTEDVIAEVAPVLAPPALRVVAQTVVTRGHVQAEVPSRQYRVSTPPEYARNGGERRLG